MQPCPICVDGQIDSPFETSVEMCGACALTYGVMPMVPSRRPPMPCQRCNCMKFIRAMPRELAPGNLGSGEINAQEAAPMTVTFQLDRHKGWFSTSALPLNPRNGFGQLEMYICKKCGFIEWYCNDPEKVPIGPGYMTQDIDYGDTDTPYRG